MSTKNVYEVVLCGGSGCDEYREKNGVHNSLDAARLDPRFAASRAIKHNSPPNVVIYLHHSGWKTFVEAHSKNGFACKPNVRANRPKI